MQIPMLDSLLLIVIIDVDFLAPFFSVGFTDL